MTLEEKKACRCDMCKRLNVNKRYKAGFDGQPKDDHEQKSEIYKQIEKDVTKDII